MTVKEFFESMNGQNHQLNLYDLDTDEEMTCWTHELDEIDSEWLEAEIDTWEYNRRFVIGVIRD